MLIHEVNFKEDSSCYWLYSHHFCFFFFHQKILLTYFKIIDKYLITFLRYYIFCLFKNAMCKWVFLLYLNFFFCHKILLTYFKIIVKYSIAFLRYYLFCLFKDTVCKWVFLLCFKIIFWRKTILKNNLY